MTIDFHGRIYETIAGIGKAVSSPKRLQLLDVLCQGEKTVETLAEHVGISVKLASAHLKILRTARLLEARKEGKHVLYRAANAGVSAFWVRLRSLAESQFAEIERTLQGYFADRSGMSRVDRATLLRRAREGEVVVIDVRPADEYRQGHIPRSWSIPLTDLRKRLSRIPKSKEVVAYCRGPYCVLSAEAVELLRKRGYRAMRMSDGVAEWAAAGLPLERGLP